MSGWDWNLAVSAVKAGNGETLANALVAEMDRLGLDGVDIDLEGDTIRRVKYTNGCNGNTQGVSILVEGMKAEDVIAKLEGIRCGFKATSCPDQLAKAIRLALAE